MKQKSEAPSKLLRTFFRDRGQKHEMSPQVQQQQKEPQEQKQRFDPIEVIKCLSEMKPITIVYGKKTQITPNQATKTEIVHEYDVQGLLRKHGDQGYQALLQENYKDGLLNLRKADIILNAYISNDGITFYKIGLLEEAYTCFETCILSAKGCILLSELGKHEEGLTFGRLAAKKCISQILDSMTICYQNLMMIAKNYQKNKSRPNSNGKPSQQKRKLDLQQTLERLSQETLHDAKNILWNDFYSPKEASIQRALTNKYETQETQTSNDTLRSTIHQENMSIHSMLDIQFEEPDLQHLFTQDAIKSSSILKLNILGLLQLKPQSFQDLTLPNDLQRLVETESVLEYISLLTVSFYCNSTETRFIDDLRKKQFKASDMTDSENWLSRSLEISYVFLPHEMPLVGQIISVHNKFHGITKQIIPEDSPLDGSYSVIKTLKGGSKSNFFIPLIRKQTNRIVLNTNPDEDFEEEFTQSSNQTNTLYTKKTQQRCESNRKNTQRRISREKGSNTIDYAGTTIQTRNKFFNQQFNQNKTLNTAGNHSQPTDQSFGSLEKVYSRGNPKAHSSERKQRIVKQNDHYEKNNSFSFNQEQQVNFQVTNNSLNNSYNNSKLVSPKNEQIHQNNTKPWLRVNQNFPTSDGNSFQNKQIDTMKNNYIGVDNFLEEIQIDKDKQGVQNQRKKKNLDIQINNNINFFINSEQLGTNFMSENILSRQNINPQPPSEQNPKHFQIRNQRVQTQNTPSQAQQQLINIPQTQLQTPKYTKPDQSHIYQNQTSKNSAKKIYRNKFKSISDESEVHQFPMNNAQFQVNNQVNIQQQLNQLHIYQNQQQQRPNSLKKANQNQSKPNSSQVSQRQNKQYQQNVLNVTPNVNPNVQQIDIKQLIQVNRQVQPQEQVNIKITDEDLNDYETKKHINKK